LASTSHGTERHAVDAGTTNQSYQVFVTGPEPTPFDGSKFSDDMLPENGPGPTWCDRSGSWDYNDTGLSDVELLANGPGPTLCNLTNRYIPDGSDELPVSTINTAQGSLGPTPSSG
jgi:hypothetical protein